MVLLIISRTFISLTVSVCGSIAFGSSTKPPVWVIDDNDSQFQNKKG